MKTEMNCPLCSAALVSVEGTSLNARDGVTVYCPSKICPAQEVAGHGRNEKEAFEVIQEKCKFGMKKA